MTSVKVLCKLASHGLHVYIGSVAIKPHIELLRALSNIYHFVLCAFCCIDSVCGSGPLRVFAKYLKNGLVDLHEILWDLEPLYRSSFKIKSLRIGHSMLPW